MLFDATNVTSSVLLNNKPPDLIASSTRGALPTKFKVDNKTVWTGVENKAAQRVYERNGYIRDGYVSTVLIK